MSGTHRHKPERVWRDQRPVPRRANPNCVEKRCFPDEVTARAVGLVSLEERGGKELWVYKCPHCKRWHLTKVKHAERYRVSLPTQTTKINESRPSADAN